MKNFNVKLSIIYAFFSLILPLILGLIFTDFLAVIWIAYGIVAYHYFLRDIIDGLAQRDGIKKSTIDFKSALKKYNDQTDLRDKRDGIYPKYYHNPEVPHRIYGRLNIADEFSKDLEDQNIQFKMEPDTDPEYYAFDFNNLVDLEKAKEIKRFLTVGPVNLEPEYRPFIIYMKPNGDTETKYPKIAELADYKCPFCGDPTNVPKDLQSAPPRHSRIKPLAFVCINREKLGCEIHTCIGWEKIPDSVKDLDYICAQCGPDSNGPQVHALTNHHFPLYDLEDARAVIAMNGVIEGTPEPINEEE